MYIHLKSIILCNITIESQLIHPNVLTSRDNFRKNVVIVWELQYLSNHGAEFTSLPIFQLEIVICS